MPDMRGPFYWNPGAISFLVELLLTLLLAGYIAHRLVREHRGGGISAPTLLLGMTFVFFVPGLFVSLLHALTGGGWTSYAMPWLPPRSPYVLAMPWVPALVGVSVIAFVQFAYRFPARLAGSERESLVVAAIMALCVCAEIASSAYTDWTLIHHRIWFRPDWAAVWTSASMVWAIIVFLRQFAAAQAGMGHGSAGVRGVLRAMVSRSPNREARAARGFVVYSLLPFTHAASLVLQHDGLLGAMSMDILISWSVLVQLTGLTLVYFGYLPERSSFIFKLTTISVVLLFGAISGASWVMNPAISAQYSAPGLPQSLQALRFAPDRAGGYSIAETRFAPVEMAGRPVGPDGVSIALPFDFRFYGRRYRRVHVAADGSIGLDSVPSAVEAALGYGPGPAIRPLLVRLPDTGSRVTVREEHGTVIVSRRDGCAEQGQPGCYAWQTILRRHGAIDVHYVAVPPQPGFVLFDPLAAPWLTGITPGLGASAAEPVVLDYYRGFLAHQDQLFAPVIPYIFVTLLAVLIGIPLLFQGFLVRPLSRLLQGMRRFRDGDLSMQVAVTYNDEIGYLTESFNEMAHAQHRLVNTLEDEVARRSGQLAELAGRNARLEERNRLSGDLHDTVTQTLFSAAMLSEGLAEQWRSNPEEGLQRMEQVERMNRLALAEMRMMLTELRNEDIVEKPLASLISALVEDFASAHPDKAKIDCTLAGDTLLPLDVQAMMYRIAQESLNNIVRHAAASRIEITLEALPGQAMLSVTDDGCGFDPQTVPPGHLGLEIMRERASRIDAVLEIETAPGQGTRITAIWMQPD